MKLFQKLQYYAIIGVISFIAVFFLPMIGSTAGLSWNIPTSLAGWVVYIVGKIIIAVINILIFYCFMEQAKVNIRENKNYKEANDILLIEIKKKELEPRSPQKWQSSEYRKKGIAIFTTSILSAVGLTQAILTFDWVSMLTYIFIIIMGIIFGIIQMNKAEDYWTNEYWQYAQLIKSNKEKKNGISTDKHDSCNYRGQTIQELGTTSTEEQRGHCEPLCDGQSACELRD